MSRNRWLHETSESEDPRSAVAAAAARSVCHRSAAIVTFLVMLIPGGAGRLMTEQAQCGTAPVTDRTGSMPVNDVAAVIRRPGEFLSPIRGCVLSGPRSTAHKLPSQSS